MDIIKDRDKIIDEMLPKMYDLHLEGKYFDVESYIIKNCKGIDLINKPYILDRFIQVLEDKDLILKSTDKPKMLTAHAKQICESGGWSKHLKIVRLKKILLNSTIYLIPFTSVLIAGYSAYQARVSADNTRQLEQMRENVRHIDSTILQLEGRMEKMKLELDSVTAKTKGKEK